MAVKKKKRKKPINKKVRKSVNKTVKRKRRKRTVKEKFDFKNLVSPMWTENLMHIKNDVQNEDYDAFFVVSGYEGNGKSTFAYISCKILNRLHGNDTIFFYKKEWERRKYKLEKYDTIQFTEGTEFAMAKESMTIEVREFEKDITQWRGRNMFFFMEISDLEMLSKYLRKSRALGLIWIPRRGVAWIYSFVVHNSRDAKRVGDVKKKIYANQFPYPDLIVKFKDVPKSDKEWAIYKKRKKHFMKEDRETKRVRVARQRIEKKLDGSMTYREIATVYGVKKPTVENWIHGDKVIGKSYLFKDFTGRVRIDKKGMKLLDKRMKKKRGIK